MSSDLDRHRAFTRLYETHARAILAFALRRLGRAADAEDAVAETFVVAWRRFADAPEAQSALPWLYAIARRVIANQQRGSERRIRLHDRLRASPIDPVEPRDDDGTGPALAALSRMRPDDQELLRLVAWENLAHGEIAVVLGITPNAVAIRLHRARARFEQALAAELDSSALKDSRVGRTSTRVKGRLFGRAPRGQAP